MANITLTLSKQQDKQILCQTWYNQPIIAGIENKKERNPYKEGNRVR
jgi:hypothetical protein